MSTVKKIFTPTTDKVFRFIVAPLVLVLVAALIVIGFFDYEDMPAEAAVLKRGSSGDTVRELQTRLKNWGYYTGSVDGIYGSQTVAAVKYFQRVNQVAVGAVVLNRVRSSSFPNTIAGVIYQPWAFSVVNDGQINLAPNQTAINAARDAMNGWDPTYGCLYYYNPKTATNSWIKQKPIHLSIGNHVFCA